MGGDDKSIRLLDSLGFTELGRRVTCRPAGDLIAVSTPTTKTISAKNFAHPGVSKLNAQRA